MASSYPMLRYGSSGQEVRRLQQALNRAGYSLEVDGGFGEKTRAALMDYQRRAGMTPDGVAGSKTWASLGLQSAQDRLADLEKGYTPSRETQEARRSWEELAARQPGDYTSPYADRMEDLLRQMESREAFSYDPSRDEMFRRYARLYQRQGQTAMEDTLGQAAGLTGGYDSSYARQAGQQEYNRYMQELAALVPQLQQDAWDRYETQGQALLDQYKLLQGQDEDAYGQWRDRVEDWQDASRQARDRYESLEKQDYSNYLALMKYYASRAKQEQDAALAQQKLEASAARSGSARASSGGRTPQSFRTARAARRFCSSSCARASASAPGGTLPAKLDALKARSASCCMAADFVCRLCSRNSTTDSRPSNGSSRSAPASGHAPPVRISSSGSCAA